MSLSAAEKVRVVQALDRLGVGFVEAGFPELEPEGGRALRAARRGRARAGAGLRVRHDPPARARRRGRPGAARPGRLRRARRARFVGKTWALHLEKVTRVSPRGEPGDDRRLGQLRPRRGQARDLRRRALLRRLARRPRLRARVPARRGRRRGRERHPLRHQRLEPARPGRRGHGGRGRRRWASASRSASTPTTTPSAGSRTRSPPSRPGARLVQGTINGYGERCGNANLVSILPALQLKLGYDCVPADRLRLLTETAHFVDELTNTTPDPDQPYVGRNAFAHKGGMHVAGVQADARTFEHLDPAARRQQPRRADLRALGQGLGAVARRERRHRPRRRRGQARGRADQGARAPRLSLRGRRRLVRAAAAARGRRRTSRCSGSRASA